MIFRAKKAVVRACKKPCPGAKEWKRNLLADPKGHRIVIVQALPHVDAWVCEKCGAWAAVRARKLAEGRCLGGTHGGGQNILNKLKKGKHPGGKARITDLVGIDGLQHEMVGGSDGKGAQAHRVEEMAEEQEERHDSDHVDEECRDLEGFFGDWEWWWRRAATL